VNSWWDILRRFGHVVQQRRAGKKRFRRLFGLGLCCALRSGCEPGTHHGKNQGKPISAATGLSKLTAAGRHGFSLAVYGKVLRAAFCPGGPGRKQRRLLLSRPVPPRAKTAGSHASAHKGCGWPHGATNKPSWYHRPSNDTPDPFRNRKNEAWAEARSTPRLTTLRSSPLVGGGGGGCCVSHPKEV